MGQVSPDGRLERTRLACAGHAPQPANSRHVTWVVDVGLDARKTTADADGRKPRWACSRPRDFAVYTEGFSGARHYPKP